MTESTSSNCISSVDGPRLPGVDRNGVRFCLVWRDVRVGLSVWLATGIIVLGSGAFGWAVMQSAPTRHASVLYSLANWDGGWYAGITATGYYYEPGMPSNAAFFPAFPWISAALARTSGCSERLAMIIVAQLCLAVAFVAFHSYLRIRFRDVPAEIPSLTLLAFAVFPPTFFFRMAYSEGLFVCLLALILLAIECRGPLWLVALLVGFASGTRPVGAGLAILTVRELFLRSTSRRALVMRSLVLVPLSLWGLLFYVGYLAYQFGEPFAFINAQEAWDCHRGATSSEKWVALLTFQPIWWSFMANSGHCYVCGTPIAGMTFSASALNATVFIAGLLLILVGARKRWLNTADSLAALCLFGIPYVTRAFESQFLSFARFTAVVLPIYIPLAIMLMRLPFVLRILWLLLNGWITALLAMSFAAGYYLI